MNFFGTDGIRGLANKHPLKPEVIVKIGRGIGLYFKRKHKNPGKTKIIIGKDTRLSGYMIETAIISGLCSAGVNAYLVGPMPTPAVAHLVKSFAADAGIVISASHNPFQDNGIKIFDSDGYKLNELAEEEIESLIESDEEVIGEDLGKAFRIDDAGGRYIEFAKSSIGNLSLKGLKIVVDCANGAAYSVAPKIFSELGAEVIVMHNKPNGKNINKNCGALHPESLVKKVVEEKADAGIALDGDADRVIMVDENGKVLDGDDILFMNALFLKDHNRLKNNLVVATVMSNFGFEKALNERGIKLVRVNVGDKHVAMKMKEIGASIGGEQSGHIIFRDYSTTGDGTITALQTLRVLKKTGKKLSYFSNLIKKTPQILVNLEVEKKIPINNLPKTKEAILKLQRELDGNGRILVRYSGTQNLLRVMVEGTDESLIKNFAERIVKIADEEINKSG